jgi:predicted dehydrogenase
MRAAVIGCGFIGAAPGRLGAGAQSHAAAWARQDGVRLVALCDSDPVALRAAMERWGVGRGFEELDELLVQVRPEIVSVCTPDATHAPVLRRVLEAPSVRAVLAEKPLALDSDDARGIVRTAEERGVLLAVNYGRRSLPSHRRLQAWLQEGGIGAIRAVNGVYSRGLKHNGTHWLDLARFLVGEIVQVVGFGTPAHAAEDPTVDVALRFASGARGTLSGVPSLTYSIFEMDLIGSTGRVRVVEAGHRFDVTAVGPSPRFADFQELLPAPGPLGGLEDLVGHAAADLWSALNAGRPPACSGWDGVVALELAEAALGRTVSLRVNVEIPEVAR